MLRKARNISISHVVGYGSQVKEVDGRDGELAR